MMSTTEVFILMDCAPSELVVYDIGLSSFTYYAMDNNFLAADLAISGNYLVVAGKDSANSEGKVVRTLMSNLLDATDIIASTNTFSVITSGTTYATVGVTSSKNVNSLTGSILTTLTENLTSSITITDLIVDDVFPYTTPISVSGVVPGDLYSEPISLT